MTKPIVFDAERNRKSLAMLNNAFASLYIYPYLRMSSLEDVVKLWLHLHAAQGEESPIANQSDLL